MQFEICGYCGKQFMVNPRFLPHGKGYCGSYCQNADELIDQAARSIETISEDELERFAARQ